MGVYSTVNLPAGTGHWYKVQWTMLTRRLRYPGSRKARNARRRLLIHWTKDAVLKAEREIRGWSTERRRQWEIS